jgi:hypothetical protein
MNLHRQYITFHGKRTRKERDVNFHVPKGLVVLGRAVAIEYECDKLNGGGDGQKAVYRHEFETPSLVCMDETMKKQIYIIGSRLIVTTEGIEN